MFSVLHWGELKENWCCDFGFSVGSGNGMMLTAGLVGQGRRGQVSVFQVCSRGCGVELAGHSHLLHILNFTEWYDILNFTEWYTEFHWIIQWMIYWISLNDTLNFTERYTECHWMINWISLPGKTVAKVRCSSCDGGNIEMVIHKGRNQMEIQLREKGNIPWTSSLYFYLWTCLFLSGFKAWRFSAFSRVQSFS